MSDWASKVSRQYGRRVPYPTCPRCEYATHPPARSSSGELVCTHCIKSEVSDE